MGLDAFIRCDFKGVDNEIESEELWYGRKENEIHGWMQRESGIAAEDFNCVQFPLTTEILDKLEADSKAINLVPTQGFFFGSDNDPAEVRQQVKDLLSAARKALEDGLEPYYSSWW